MRLRLPLVTERRPPSNPPPAGLGGFTHVWQRVYHCDWPIVVPAMDYVGLRPQVRHRGIQCKLYNLYYEKC